MDLSASSVDSTTVAKVLSFSVLGLEITVNRLDETQGFGFQQNARQGGRGKASSNNPGSSFCFCCPVIEVWGENRRLLYYIANIYLVGIATTKEKCAM